MTFAELLSDVRETIDLHPDAERIQNAEIKRLMNLKMRDISLEIGVPTVYVTVPTSTTVTGAFKLPLKIHPEGVKYAEVVEITPTSTDVASADIWRNRELAILSRQEANEFHPRWENDSEVEYQGIPFLVYSPADPDSGFKPVGFSTAQYRFLVHAVPEDMSAMTDEPFAILDCEGDSGTRQPGAMPNFHRVLSYFVSHELLQRLGDQRWQAYFSRYNDMMDRMYASIQPTKVYLPKPRMSRKVRRYA